MSTPPPDGGPAFPLSPEVGKAHFDDPMAYPGMTLRDWFAGQALAGMLANTHIVGTINRIAEHAYHYADAMLTARHGEQEEKK